MLAEIRALEARNPSGSLLFQGSTAALAAAELQGLVNRVVEAAGGGIESSEIVPEEAVEPFVEVGVLIRFGIQQYQSGLLYRGKDGVAPSSDAGD